MASEEATTAVSRFQNRIPASLYEVAWQYSLFDWYAASQSSAIDWDLAPEHLAYLTPRAKSGLFGKDDSLVVVYADLSDPTSPTLRSDEDGGPVEIRTYTAPERFRVGHSYPEKKTSNMTDYSITTHKNADAHHIAGLRDDGWGTNNIQDRFTTWAQSEYAEQVRDEATDEDAAVLEALGAIGDDEELMDHLADSFLNLVESEDEEIDALITVAVRLPEEKEYKLPGEVGVLNDVMRAKKASRLENISVDDASGAGTGYVTGNDGTVTGGSPGLFGMNGKLQREHIPNLDPHGTDAWRGRPLEFDTAAAIAAANSLFEDFFRGLGQNRRLYVLPYLAARRDELTPEMFTWFHERVYERLQSAETGSEGDFDDVVDQLFADANRVDNTGVSKASNSQSPFENDSKTDATDVWDHVRFAVVHQVTGNPDRVFFGTLDGVEPVVELDNAHSRVVGSEAFVDDGIFHNNPTPDSSPLLGTETNRTRYMLYGGYFQRTTEPTRTSRKASETPGAGDIDDSRMSRVRNLLTDSKIDAHELLVQYIHQLVQDQREQFGSGDDYIPFPKRSVVEQYVQLRALTSVGALDTKNTFSFTSTPMTNQTTDRNARLDSFIESHDALNDDPEVAVFTLGGLVGRTSAYQSYKEVSSTLIRRYPVDYLTKQTVKEVTKEVLQMNNSYAEADGERSYWTDSRYTERLTETMLTVDPTDWSLSEAELQWLYSLGIAYGLSDQSMQTDEDSDETEAEATPNQ
ncbi:TM1802 family CRISPR-associated protein [Haloferax sp. ATB1]|uniref:TM1802 family CRISPR-associated protein n=1 Tax=Haloferax sp. ATB1 TaxID=1508454 RepID=UPI0005B1FF86|nr:TM1802 family CRISPR-associated protein [Haloferax sp. ATB1]